MNFDDIEQIAPGVSDLSADEHEALQKFTIVWSLFEAQVLDCNASVRKIVEKVEPLNIEGDWFQEELNYFIGRYIENGNTNHRFDHLHLRANDNPARVRSVLDGTNTDIKEQLIACLTIIYRFRNNYFHGVKWTYGLKEQLSNFTHSVNLLKNCISKYGNGI